LRNWLITKTVSNGSRPLASLVDPHVHEHDDEVALVSGAGRSTSV
jgi:hypothetical protein